MQYRVDAQGNPIFGPLTKEEFEGRLSVVGSTVFWYGEAVASVNGDNWTFYLSTPEETKQAIAQHRHARAIDLYGFIEEGNRKLRSTLDPADPRHPEHRFYKLGQEAAQRLEEAVFKELTS